MNESSRWISSAFLMVSPNGQDRYTYADCGVIPDPNYEQLCNIAYESSKLHKLLNNENPNVAFLSFSTKGSADHYKVKKVQQALKLFNEKYPHISSDGEIQFDVAINKDIYKKKVGLTNFKENYNVFIFPDLDSGNIAYKITQHLAGFKALGPLLMGLKKTVHDLSRGCDVDDIVYISIIAAIQKNSNSQ
jgi:phosphate acetyltransferase